MPRTPSVKLSLKQKAILGFIQSFLDEHRIPPTVRDIQKGCEISSTSVVDYNNRVLQRQGRIRRHRDLSRGIELIGVQQRSDNNDLLKVPMWGIIAAGNPIPVPATENIEPLEVMEIPRNLASGKNNIYALRVKGESMIDALVGDGDVVILEAIKQVENGEMVAAWIKSKSEATLKKFYVEGNRVRLQPANKQLTPIFVDAEDVEICGRVVGVLRTV